MEQYDLDKRRRDFFRLMGFGEAGPACPYDHVDFSKEECPVCGGFVPNAMELDLWDHFIAKGFTPGSVVANFIYECWCQYHLQSWLLSKRAMASWLNVIRWALDGLPPIFGMNNKAVVWIARVINKSSDEYEKIINASLTRLLIGADHGPENDEINRADA